MAKFIWTLRMAWLLRMYGEKNIIKAFRWASDECWQEYRLDGHTPAQAMDEDMSYAEPL